MNAKNQKKLGGKDHSRKDQQKPAHDAVGVDGSARGTGKPAPIAEKAVAPVVSPEQPKAPAKTPKAAKRPATDAATEHKADEIVVFAFRMLRSERDELHAATGSAKASKFVKAIVLAGARGDMKAIQEIVDEAQAGRK